MPTAKDDKANNGKNKDVQQDYHFSKKDTSFSEQSLSSVVSNTSVSQDESFDFPKHAEDSLRVMERYLHEKQLTDVTLIAGKQSR